MAIRVTCRSCHTRFNVSDKFAGREGPCPKCRKVIKIPALTEKVKIHAPEDAGPKDSSGHSVVKPVFRQETAVSGLGITIVVGLIVAFLALALMLRFQVADKVNFPTWLTIVGAICLALPTVYAAYSFLRDSELAPDRGSELWSRMLSCSAVYVLLWAAMPIAEYAVRGYGSFAWIGAIAVMIVLGAGVAVLIFGFDYFVPV